MVIEKKLLKKLLDFKKDGHEIKHDKIYKLFTEID